MGDLTETQARRSETELMRGRLWHLTQRPSLTARERIGACLALEILDARAAELDERRTVSLAEAASSADDKAGEL